MGKRVGIGLLMIIVGITVIFSVPIFLIGMWNSGETPTTYVIMDVIRNDGNTLENCNDPYITNIKDVVTDTTSYVCGDKGKISKIISMVR